MDSSLSVFTMRKRRKVQTEIPCITIKDACDKENKNNLALKMIQNFLQLLSKP